MARHFWSYVSTGLAVLVLVAAAARDVHNDADSLPGWMGTDYQPPHVDRVEDRDRYMEVLNADARIFLWHGFLTPEEADHIRDVAEKRLERSGVVDGKGGSEVSQIRTSFGTFLERGEDEIIERVEARIAKWSLMPVANGEGLQVLRYQHGQKYDAHWDYFFDDVNTKNGGNRYSTVLMYLEDTEEGGETVFPQIPAPGGTNKGFSDCAKHHLAARPKKGDAVMFHSMRPDGKLERRSMHTACPVLKGIKWSAAKWIHQSHYNMGDKFDLKPEAPLGRGECKDVNEMCSVWAAQGECTNNPAYMVGNSQRPGNCLLSCKRCDVLHSGKTEEAHDPQE